MDATALPYIDALFKEYLLFRGFPETLQAFSAELKADKIQGFQVEHICSLLFRRVIPSLQCTQLMELLQELDQHVYCRLDRHFEETVGRMEVAMVRYYVVTAVKAHRLDKVKELFELYGELLLSAKDGPATWYPWFSLPYITKPEADPRFLAFFTPHWASLVETSFRNFLTQAFQQLPLPAVLRYDADRAKRAELQRAVDVLRRENAELRARLGLAPAVPAPGSAGGSTFVSSSPTSLAAATAAVAAAVATNLAGSRPATPVEGNAAAAVLHLQQHQQRRVSSGPQLQLLGRASGEAEDSTSHASSASLASQDAWISEGTVGSGSLPPPPAVGSQPPPRQGQGQPSSPGEAVAAPADPGAQVGIAHGRTASLADWHSGGTAWEGSPTRVPSQDLAHAAQGAGAIEGGSTEQVAARAAVRGVLQQREVLPGAHEGPITCCVFGPQGTHVASASGNGTVRIWAPRSLAELDSRAGGSARAAQAAARSGGFSCGAPVTRLAWDRRGDKLMLVGTRGRGIKAWHLDTQRLVFQVDSEAEAPLVTDLACSPADPTFVCATSDYGLRRASLALWNMRAFKKAHTFALPGSCGLTSASFSPDGHQLVTAGIDGKVRLFDPTSRTQVMAWPAADPGVPFTACFMGSSRLLATLSADGYIKLWSTAVVRGPLAGLHVPLCCAAGSAGGGLPLLGDAAGSPISRRGSAGRAASAAGGGLSQQPAQQLPWRPQLACNQAGTVLAASSGTQEVPVVFVGGGGEDLRLETGLLGHAGAVPALDWHPDSNTSLLLSGSIDGSLILSDLRQRSVTS